ncbi:MAG: hypothetical protein J6Y49_00380 [Alphaproteobacteria bacterium]|nr:hypothetical protein [Alphaproteobacteria bacterium]
MSKGHKINFYRSSKVPYANPYAYRKPASLYPKSKLTTQKSEKTSTKTIEHQQKPVSAISYSEKASTKTIEQPKKPVSVISYVESFVEEEEYTASQTSKNIVSLNGRFLHIRDGYTTIQNLTNLAKTMEPEPQSCIRAIEYVLDNGTFVLITEFNMKTKCTDWMDEPSDETKQKLCRKFSCAGECIDADMRKILALILPETYGTTQR